MLYVIFKISHWKQSLSLPALLEPSAKLTFLSHGAELVTTGGNMLSMDFSLEWSHWNLVVNYWDNSPACRQKRAQCTTDCPHSLQACLPSPEAALSCHKGPSELPLHCGRNSVKFFGLLLRMNAHEVLLNLQISSRQSFVISLHIISNLLIGSLKHFHFWLFFLRRVMCLLDCYCL